MRLKRLRELREKQNIKQDEMAQILNVKQTTYSKYELGKINVPLETLIKLADLYQTSVDYLIERTDEKNPYPYHSEK